MPHLMSSFDLEPKGVKFETQLVNEHIIILLRKHFITNTWWIAVGIFMFLVPMLIAALDPFLGLSEVIKIPLRLQAVAVIIWYLLTFAFVFEQFLIWYFNVYIVTNKRLVDVDFFGLLYKQISEAGLDKIQDVTHRMGGVLQVVFNYGDVIIQTAGTQEFFEFHAIPQPQKVQKAILEEIHGSHKK